jgi:hypothetical protein
LQCSHRLPLAFLRGVGLPDGLIEDLGAGVRRPGDSQASAIRAAAGGSLLGKLRWDRRCRRPRGVGKFDPGIVMAASGGQHALLDEHLRTQLHHLLTPAER